MAGGCRGGYRAGFAAGLAIAIDRARRAPRARKFIGRMDARQLRLLARRRLGRSGAKPDRIRAGGVAAVRSFVARWGVRRRVVDGLLGAESASARTGDRDAGAAIPVTTQRDVTLVGTARRPRRGSGRVGERE